MSKRKDAESLVFEVMNILDPTGINTKYYQDLFKGMSDAQFKAYINSREGFYLNIKPMEKTQEPTIENAQKALKRLGSDIVEYIAMPFIDGNTNTPIITQVPVPVGYAHAKRVQQLVSKKNTMSIDIDNRNPKTGQVINDDKNARSSDVENNALVILGAHNTLKELLGPKSDDMQMLSQMLNKIMTDGYVSLSDMESDLFNKTSLNTLDVLFLGAMLTTDLVTEDLALPRTVLKKPKPMTVAQAYKSLEESLTVDFDDIDSVMQYLDEVNSSIGTNI